MQNAIASFSFPFSLLKTPKISPKSFYMPIFELDTFAFKMSRGNMAFSKISTELGAIWGSYY